jgi:tetratricopeptide (TPR) repeat protein
MASAFASAEQLYNAGDHARSLELLTAIAESDPDYPKAARLLARLASDKFDWVLAAKASAASIALNGYSAADALLLARASHRQRKFDEAAKLYERLIREKSFPADASLSMDLSEVLVQLGRPKEGEQILREAIEAKDDAALFTQLALNLLGQSRSEEANEAARAALARDAGQTKARAVLGVGKATPTSSRRKRPVRWPAWTADFADARKVIVSSLLSGYPEGPPFIGPETKFVTLGSCFAHNLAMHLEQRGYGVHSEVIGEQVNSTYANRYFFEWLEHGATSKTTREMDDAFGPELRARYIESLASCDVFVFTLGVAASFFHPETGEFVFLNNAYVAPYHIINNYEMRTTGVEENVENLRAIIASVRRLCRKEPHIVLTVSPVPLLATTEMRSAVIADCISKSTLRVVCDQVKSSDVSGLVHYWPSFEVVRWLGPYFGEPYPPVYGYEDSKTRHVSNWIVDLIIDLFVETYSIAQKPPVAQPTPAKVTA